MTSRRRLEVPRPCSCGFPDRTLPHKGVFADSEGIEHDCYGPVGWRDWLDNLWRFARTWLLIMVAVTTIWLVAMVLDAAF